MRLWKIYHPDIPTFLQEAAKTRAMIRLQDIGMNCGCEYTGFPLFAGLAPYSRFDHSMGVGLIVWHFTGSQEQALAGLLHDIATPAFAHVVDFLHGDHMTQEHTEQGTAARIRNAPDLQQLLEQYAISPEAVDDYHRYPIADNDAPQLSADRLEYTLGNAINYGILDQTQVKVCYEDLAVGANEAGQPELMFRTLQTAEVFANAALECSKIYVSDSDRYAMQSLADLLKQAIALGVLTEDDLYLQEQGIIDRLNRSFLQQQWHQFRSFREVIRRNTPDSTGNWMRIFAKKRTIDPYVQDLGRISHLCPAFSQDLQAFRAESQDIWLCAK